MRLLEGYATLAHVRTHNGMGEPPPPSFKDRGRAERRAEGSLTVGHMLKIVSHTHTVE